MLLVMYCVILNILHYVHHLKVHIINRILYHTKKFYVVT